MNFSSRIFYGWRDSAGQVWHDYTQHEFVESLGEGRLPKPVFIAYLIQDYLFLIHFSRAWAFAVVKSESVQQMRLASTILDALINEEIQLHIRICKQQGVTQKQLQQAEEAIENIAYTRYVMDVGLSGDLLDILAVLSPCVFGYYEIGVRLKKNVERQELALPNIYLDWIHTYSSEDYFAMCESVAGLIEEVAEQRLGEDYLTSPRWKILCHKFSTATRLEVDFWQMGFRLANISE